MVVPKRSFGARVAVPKSERSAASFARFRVSWIVASRTKKNLKTFSSRGFIYKILNLNLPCLCLKTSLSKAIRSAREISCPFFADV